MRPAALLTALLAALALTAPAAAEMAPPSDAPVTIRLYNYNLASAGIGREATEEMIAAFEAANPHVTVERVPTPVSELMGMIQADMIAGNGPDLAQIGFSGLAYVAENYGIAPLEALVPPAEWAEHTAGMVPNGVALGRILGGTYGLAYVFSTPVLYYNADLFREAGLDPDTPPRTWAEVKAAAIRIHEATGKPGLLTGIFGATAGDWLFQGVIHSAGGRVLSADRSRLMFAEPEAVMALRTLREIALTGAYPAQHDFAAVETMVSGNAGMYLQTSAVQAHLMKGAWELRAAPMPAFGDRPVMPSNSGSALVILARDPLKQRAAWELMKFLTSDYGYTVITSKIGYLPLRPNAVESEDYLAPWIRQNPLIAPNLEQLTRLVPAAPLPGPNYRQINQTMMNAAERAVWGEDPDVATIMRDAQTRAQELMPR